MGGDSSDSARESYADKARSYVAAELKRGTFDQEYADRHVAYAVMKDEFAERHGVREYKLSLHNVGRLFRSAGASSDQVYAIFGCPSSHGRSRWSEATFSMEFQDAFDHADLWGRDGKPLILVGHPYSDRDRHQAVYDAIAALGLEVRFDGESYYGHGTRQVLVRSR
jgi:hypothetical protein